MNLLCEAIERAWLKTTENVESRSELISSEKTLVFSFMWELKTILSNVKFDFEYRAYEQIDEKDKYLDLLIYLDETNKVALEFKLPKSTISGNSNRTQTRENIYRDIMRLNYLVVNSINNIKRAYFLCGTNESAYLNEGTYKINPEFKVHNEYLLKSYFQSHIFSQYPCLNENISFDWTNIELIKGKNVIKGKFAWLLISI